MTDISNKSSHLSFLHLSWALRLVTNLLNSKTEVKDAVGWIALSIRPAHLPYKLWQAFVQLLRTQGQKITFHPDCRDDATHQLPLANTSRNTQTPFTFTNMFLTGLVNYRVWSPPQLWRLQFFQKTAPSVSRRGCRSELWEAASASPMAPPRRSGQSSAQLPASCSPAVHNQHLLHIKFGQYIFNFYWHTCLLGCGRGTGSSSSSSSSSFDSARTGGREKLMSSSIPSRTGAGSNAETTKNTPSINLIYIIKILTWLGCLFKMPMTQHSELCVPTGWIFYRWTDKGYSNATTAASSQQKIELPLTYEWAMSLEPQWLPWGKSASRSRLGSYFSSSSSSSSELLMEDSCSLTSFLIFIVSTSEMHSQVDMDWKLS